MFVVALLDAEEHREGVSGDARLGTCGLHGVCFAGDRVVEVAPIVLRLQVVCKHAGVQRHDFLAVAAAAASCHAKVLAAC